MDQTRFDTLARSFTETPSRRSALGLLASSALGGLLTLGTISTEAKKKKKKKKKKTPAAVVPPPPITCAQICAGCCDASGICQAGTTSAVCGTGGAPCATCTGEQVCTNGECAGPPCGAGGVCRVFVTSTTHNGNLKGSSASGLAGADAICQGLATAAGLPGTYRAWLSDSTNSPDTRFVKSPGPYELVDGTQVANNYADLTDDSLDGPINRTETGALAEANVWTNTRSNGTASVIHCLDWTSSSSAREGIFGSSTSTNAGWTSGITIPCSAPLRLYCFQQS